MSMVKCVTMTAMNNTERPHRFPDKLSIVATATHNVQPMDMPAHVCNQMDNAMADGGSHTMSDTCTPRYMEKPNIASVGAMIIMDDKMPSKLCIAENIDWRLGDTNNNTTTIYVDDDTNNNTNNNLRRRR